MAIGLQKVPLDGGVNGFVDPMDLPDNQLQPSPNFCARVGEEPGIRPSMSFVREVVPDYRPWNSDRHDAGATTEKYYKWAKNWRPMRFMFSPWGGEIVGIFQTVAAQQIIHSDNSVNANTPKILDEQNAVLWMLPSLYAGGDTNGGPYVYDLGPCTRAPSLFMFDGIIYAFGGSNTGANIEEGTTGTIGPTLGWNYTKNDFGADNVDFFPEQACVIRNRAVYSIGSRLYFSDRNDPLSISTAGTPAVGTRDIYLGGEEQESITALADLGTSADGSPVQSVIAAWTYSHMYMLLGEPGETTETDPLGSLQINKMNIQCGCVSQATVTRTPYGTFWVGSDDVWFMPFGSLPIRVGTSIRQAIKAMPPALQYRICAEYSDGFYRVALASDGSGPDAASPLDQQWWLNLNDGAPQSAETAQWWGPMNLVNNDSPTVENGTPGSGMWAFARDLRGTGDGKLYSLQPYKMYGAAVPGNINGMTLCGWDQYTGRDVGAPTYERREWQAGTNYFEGDMVVPAPSSDDFRAPAWVCTTAGTSHASTEPGWLASTAASITDNTVVWKPIYFDTNKPMSAYRPPADNGPNGNETTKGYNEIEFVLNSKEYTLGDVMVEKLLDGAEFAYWAQTPTQVTYSTTPDAQSRSRILEHYDPVAGAAVLGTDSFNKQKRRKLLTPDPTKRFNALTAIAKVSADAGIVIEEGYNDTLKLTGALLGTETTVTIAAGHYESLAELWVAVQAAAATAGLALQSTYEADGNTISRARFGIRWVGQPIQITLSTWTKLAGLFGYAPTQAGDAATNPTYLIADESAQRRYMTNFQVAGLNIRFRTFGRRPV